jgi:glycosyltransferase involved in cell wall biosynthesis
MRSSLVSIIVPCYNYGHFLQETLDSIYAQSHEKIEIIVVNDGSSDNTSSVMEANKNRIRQVHQNNMGLSEARNSAIKEAKGDYLIFLDSDDLLTKNHLKKSVEYLDANPSCPGTVCHNIQFGLSHSGKASIKNEWPLPKNPKNLEAIFCFRNIAPPHAYTIRRELASITGTFDPAMKACEDYDYWFRYFSQHGAPSIIDSTVMYRQHSHSMSKKYDRQFYFDHVMSEKIFARITDNSTHIFGHQKETELKCKLLYSNLASSIKNMRNNIRINQPNIADKCEHLAEKISSELLQVEFEKNELFTLIIKKCTKRYNPNIHKKIPNTLFSRDKKNQDHDLSSIKKLMIEIKFQLKKIRYLLDSA